MDSGAYIPEPRCIIITQTLIALSHLQVYVACSIHLFSLQIFWPEYAQWFLIASQPVMIPVAQIGLMGSTYCTMALTIERYLAVCYPFLPRR